MVSTRKKVYKSPPRSVGTPSKTKEIVKKLNFDSSTVDITSSESCPSENQEKLKCELKTRRRSSRLSESHSQIVGEPISSQSSVSSVKSSLTKSESSQSDVLIVNESTVKSQELPVSGKEKQATGKVGSPVKRICTSNVETGQTHSVQSKSPLDVIDLSEVDDPKNTSDLFVIDSKDADLAEEVFEIDTSVFGNAAADESRALVLSESGDDDDDDSDEGSNNDTTATATTIESKQKSRKNSSQKSNAEKFSCLEEEDSDSNSDNEAQSFRIDKSKQVILDNLEESTATSTDSDLFIIDKGSNSEAVAMDSDLFIIDKGSKSGRSQDMTKPTEEENAEDNSSSSDDSDEEDGQIPPSGYNLASRIHCPLDLSGMSYINFDPLRKKSSKQTKPQAAPMAVLDKQVDELMKKSVYQPGFDKQQIIDPLIGKREAKRDRKAERDKTKGAKWFNMAAPEMTSELKNDLSVVQMRKALDPKRFYKNNDRETLPKYFQMGRVVETAADYYHSRLPKKQRKANIVEELLADAEFRKYNKRKYAETLPQTGHRSKGAYKHAKRLKKRK